ncbi:MAG: glutaredoxin-related protein [Bacillariaceae sp.]|jgi:glutaredoxin-related protein
MKSFSVLSLLSLPSMSMALSGEVTRNPNPVIKSMAQGMNLLKPIFSNEAKIQAAILGFNVDEQIVSEEIAEEVKSNPVLIYTYGLSPFSTEAIAILEGKNCDFKTIEVGAEWFLLGGTNSVKRVLLSEFVDNGATSLPKVFVNGQCIGGCAELADSVSSGEFDELLSKKGAKKEKKGLFPFF